MPEPDWMAGTIGPAEYEFAPPQGYRLGLIAGFDRETGHHPGWVPTSAGSNRVVETEGIANAEKMFGHGFCRLASIVAAVATTSTLLETNAVSAKVVPDVAIIHCCRHRRLARRTL
jgi:hypothetical protein